MANNPTPPPCPTPGRVRHFTRVPFHALEDPRLSASTLGVFAMLLKGHWTNERTLDVTVAELTRRCRLSDRATRTHLARLRECGYIETHRDYSTWGGAYRISLTYDLRQRRESAPDGPLPTAEAETPSSDPEAERYGRYLAGREWSLLKRQVKARSGGTCERCRANPSAAVHHLTYARKYHEDLADLWDVCRGCHDFIHGKTDVDPLVVGGGG